MICSSLKTFVSQPTFYRSVCKRFLQTTSSLNMPIKTGDKLPAIDLFEGAPDAKVNAGDALSKGKVVIFGVPGAFTPTCNNDHVPGFLSSIDAIKAKGVDTIACVAVNDPFVMSAWGNALDPSGKIRFLADTTASFAKALDVSFDVTAVLGNIRNKRYVLVAENGVVKGINVEPDGAGLTCSSANDVMKML